MRNVDDKENPFQKDNIRIAAFEIHMYISNIYIYIYISHIYSHIYFKCNYSYMNEIVPFAEARIDLEIIIQSEVNQKEKNKYLIISLICEI